MANFKVGDKFRYVNGGYRSTYEIVEVIGGNGLPGEPTYQLELVGRTRLGDQKWVTATSAQIAKHFAPAAPLPPTDGELEPDPPAGDVTVKVKEKKNKTEIEVPQK